VMHRHISRRAPVDMRPQKNQIPARSGGIIACGDPKEKKVEFWMLKL
jgi:hypothetical protein